MSKMQNLIKNINIANFKSINSIKIEGCRRINLFIGRPNVGKSNILEALSFFSLPYLRENTSKKLSSFVRVENESELFFNGNTQLEASIVTDIGKCEIGYHSKDGLLTNINFFSDSYYLKIDSNLKVSNNSYHESFEPPVKKYSFKSDVKYKKSHAKYLIPPFGSNLLSVIENYPELKQQVTNLFKDYSLDIAFDKASQTIKIIQVNKEKDIFLVPYNSIADTLQRVIFYKTAIASNDNSILLFEEPEAHSFPPYMTQLTQEMIYKKDNQFFITTHSPFILNDLLENAVDELAVFIVQYGKSGTRIRKMEGDELHEVFQNGIDLFTNSESFV